MRAFGSGASHRASGRRGLDAVFKGLARRGLDAAIAAFPGVMLRVSDYVVAQRREQRTASRPAAVTLPRKARPAPPLEASEPGDASGLLALLAHAPDSLAQAEVLALLNEAGVLREWPLHQYLNGVFRARRLDLLEAAVACERIGFPEARLFHRLKLAQYRGHIAMTGEEIMRCYRELRGSARFREAAANLATDLFARIGDVAGLVGFLGELSDQEMAQLAPPTFLGCFRLLESHGRVAALADRRDACLAGLGEEARLYFLEIMKAERFPDRKLAERSWRQVAERFATVYSAPDAADAERLRRWAIEPLLSLPDGPGDLMNIRFDMGQRRRLLGLTSGALAEGRPLSLVRLGDGEAYGYAGLEPAGIDRGQAEADNRIRERMWWGLAPEPEERDRIAERFRQAVRQADIVGVPSIYRIIRDRAAAYTPLGAQGSQRGLAIVLAQLGSEVSLTGRTFTEERCHQLLFNREGIEALCAQARRVVLVSCWTREQVAIAGCPDLRQVVVPAHSKVAAAADGAPAGALSRSFSGLVEEMEGHCGPGTLVLVGAGFIGKIFIAHAKARGAVALDVGAMLDYLAGYKTRSLADLA